LKIKRFSDKQLEVLTWWLPSSPHSEFDAIICDGAVRSGKTLCMGLSFVCWATFSFDKQQFALCGKTVTSLRRNVISVLLPLLRSLGFNCTEKLSRNTVTISFGGRSNTFYLFGGRDEGSAALIQGVTLAGILLDEVALMPRSFVEQSLARCSVPKSRLWFNCNPEGPWHWFYREWILKAQERKALHLHFTMADNPSLTREIVERYERMYSGVFHRRFILGEWVHAEGLVYDFFDESYIKEPPGDKFERFVISCDYGTVNPASFGLWGKLDGVWYRIKEFYYDSRREKRQKTDAEYLLDLKALAGGRKIESVVVDPSAASFMELLRREGFSVLPAENDVLSGIRITADLLKSGKIVISPSCEDSIREFGLYSWSESATGRDAPKKENDHAMDDIRYFAATIAAEREDMFFATFVER
jgi:PBSX family phage terminase large subunit